MSAFSGLFGRLKSVVIGMIHLHALPGSPGRSKALKEVMQIACQEADIYYKAKVDGLLIENMYDLPWMHPSQMGPETTASMAVICSEIRRQYPHIPMGVQVLSAGNKEALAIAKAAGLNFIRAEGYVFSHIGDEGPMHSCAAELTRYRRLIEADHIHIYADVKKKHCSHAITADLTLVDTAVAAELFCADGIIVTGKVTGKPADPEAFKEVQEAVRGPVLVGSGITEANAHDYITANGMIVGSHLKKHGEWHQELDEIRVNSFMQKVVELREQLDRDTAAAAAPKTDEGFFALHSQGE